MSVRRLADASVQPAAFAFSGENQAWAEKKMTEYPPGRQQSAVIPLLMRAQEQEGWVSRAVIESIAQMLGMAYIRVLEVATFYTMFLLQPVGTRAHIQVCGTTPCMLRGAEALREVCQHKIHHDPFITSADGTMSWEEVECLGACVNAPMVMIGKDTYEDLTVERFEAIVDAFAAGNGTSIRPGPQIERQFSAAEGGETTLLEEPTAERTYKPFPPPAAAPAAQAPAAPAPAAAQPPTTPGKKQEVPEEAAPALKGPPGAPKVTEAAADAARDKVNDAARADGKPNDAMRENATGAESPAGKVDGGAAVAKGEPRKLFDAPAGPADNLRIITGIGPVLERSLNAIGITTWAQVSKLTPEQIAAVEGELGFKGRVTRDRWIEQAEALARGGIEEYRKVFGKDPH
jgi:NADH-quinone oxidoreductase subunit E